MTNTGVVWAGTAAFTYSGAGTLSGLLAIPSYSLSSTPVIYVCLAAFAQSETIGNCTITFADTTTLVLVPATDAALGIASAIYHASDSRLSQSSSVGVTIDAASSVGTGSISAVIIDGNWSGTPAPSLNGANVTASASSLSFSYMSSPNIGDLIVALCIDSRFNARSDLPLSGTLPSGWELETRDVSLYINAGGFNTQTSTGIFTYIAETSPTVMTVRSGSGIADVLSINAYEVVNLITSGSGKRAFAAVIGD